jgi:hypothetical protein
VGNEDVLEVLLYAVQSTGPRKRAEFYANELKIFPGGWALGWEDKGETGYIAVLEKVALSGVETARKISTADVDQPAQWVRGLEVCGGTVSTTVAITMIKRRDN